jgi:hypothetical protein
MFIACATARQQAGGNKTCIDCLPVGTGYSFHGFPLMRIKYIYGNNLINPVLTRD